MEYVSAVLSCEARDKSPLDFSEMSDLRKGKLILQMSKWFSSPVSLSPFPFRLVSNGFIVHGTADVRVILSFVYDYCA